jgi:hypothetical protein
VVLGSPPSEHFRLSPTSSGALLHRKATRDNNLPVAGPLASDEMNPAVLSLEESSSVRNGLVLPGSHQSKPKGPPGRPANMGLCAEALSGEVSVTARFPILCGSGFSPHMPGCEPLNFGALCGGLKTALEVRKEVIMIAVHCCGTTTGTGREHILVGNLATGENMARTWTSTRGRPE